jgi:peptidyl-prolyl cis-trans isomerase SurA
LLNIDQLDKELVLSIKNLKPGEISNPSSYTDERGRRMVRIVYLKNRTKPHRENLKDDYNRIADRALEAKKHDALAKWFQTHLPNYFISIDDAYKDCNSLAEWWRYSSK